MPRSKLAELPLSDLERRISEVIQQAVEEAEIEIAEGKWVEHAEVIGTLKRWAGEE